VFKWKGTCLSSMVMVSASYNEVVLEKYFKIIFVKKSMLWLLFKMQSNVL